MTEAVLSPRALNRALLARQGLLERSPDPLPRMLERMAGLQAQYAPSMYIGLWSRLAGFERAALTRALEAREVIQATLMRSTIHLVSAEDFWPLARATREARRTSWLRATQGDPPEVAVEAAAAKVRAALAGSATLRRKEIEALIGKAEARAVGLWVDLVRAPPSGTWERRRADLYALAEDWIGPADVEPDAAAEHLVRRYLGGFGPATAKDVASFTGLPPRDLAPVLDRLELRRFGELLDLPDGPLPDPDTPAPVRFIPTWDASLLVHARRTGILPEEHRPKIFHVKAPQSYPTFLVDGAVAGTWRHEKGRIDLSPFGRLDAADRRALEAEAERLAAFHA
ncbi:MAG TPA: winged helix DNA-binding domain-containing protein [Solirubrobacteraceae bacterium]|nr:winged helix DNA-binding domain-containing protein [Solirubrobacteraceae bacterium]